MEELISREDRIRAWIRDRRDWAAIFLEQGESRSEKGTCCLHRCRTLLVPHGWPCPRPDAQDRCRSAARARMANKRGAREPMTSSTKCGNRGKCGVEPNQHATTAFGSYVDGYGPPVHNLTSLKSQKCILKICESEWHTLTSLNIGNVFYSNFALAGHPTWTKTIEFLRIVQFASLMHMSRTNITWNIGSDPKRPKQIYHNNQKPSEN